jgi:hypothetical protein
LHRAVIVAMRAVRTMDVPVDEVIDVIAVRHRRVATVGAVLVAACVTAAAVVGSAASGVRAADGEPVLVDMVAVELVQVAVVQVVGVALVADGRMAAARTVLVIVLHVSVAAHGRLLCARGAVRGLSTLGTRAIAGSGAGSAETGGRFLDGGPAANISNIPSLRLTFPRGAS